MCPGRKCFSLFMTPKVRVILFDILSMCGVQSNEYKLLNEIMNGNAYVIRLVHFNVLCKLY